MKLIEIYNITGNDICIIYDHTDLKKPDKIDYNYDVLQVA